MSQTPLSEHVGNMLPTCCQHHQRTNGHFALKSVSGSATNGLASPAFGQNCLASQNAKLLLHDFYIIAPSSSSDHLPLSFSVDFDCMYVGDPRRRGHFNTPQKLTFMLYLTLLLPTLHVWMIMYARLICQVSMWLSQGRSQKFVFFGGGIQVFGGG